MQSFAYYMNFVILSQFVFQKNKIAIGFLWKSRNFWRVLPTRQDGFQNGEYGLLVYTTQVNSAFRACWLASSEVISQVLFASEQPKKNKMTSRFK